jgi:metal-dependent amidase/aminoacylase/carboxypeptidase family protein
MGVNALNAAMVAMSAIHAQRETYRDQDTIRIHPIITKGGVAVSSVPADVRMETYVRGASIEAFLSASEKVDRALRAGAMAVGGSVDITTLPGYLPIQGNETFLDLYQGNAASTYGCITGIS